MTNNSASACECKDLSENASYLLNSDSIFLGKVKSIEKTNDEFTSYFVKFDVDKVWNGSNAKEVMIKASLDSGICGYQFAVNQTLVVHASKEGKILYEKGCGTLPAEYVADYIQFLDENVQNTHEDYVKYDFSKEERFTLHKDIEKIPLPSDIKQSMVDWCADSSSAKKDERFWDVVPIRILLTTSEFESLQGKTDSVVINSYAAEESCPPRVEMVGTFTSESDDEHKFALSYDGDFFRYQIDDAFTPKFQTTMSPLKQIKNGASLVEVKCGEGKYPAYRHDRMRVACVSEETQVKLIERGWATMRLIDPSGSIAHALCNNYEGKWHPEHEGCRGITDLQCSLMGGKFVDNLRICYDGICPDKGYSLCVTNPDLSVNRRDSE